MYFLPTSYQNLRCRLMVGVELENIKRVFISKYQSMWVIDIVFFLQIVIFQVILNLVLNILLGWLRQVKFEEAKQVFSQSQASSCIAGKANISQKQIPNSLNNLLRSYFFVQKFGTCCFGCFYKSKLVPGRQLLLFFPFSLHFSNFPLSILMAAQCIERGTLQQQSPHTKTHRGFFGVIVSFLGIFVVDIMVGLGTVRVNEREHFKH